MPDPRQFIPLDKLLECPVCGNDAFDERLAQLNTRFATFLGFDWVDPEAVCYICSRCHYVLWFLKPPR